MVIICSAKAVPTKYTTAYSTLNIESPRASAALNNERPSVKSTITPKTKQMDDPATMYQQT